jgi:hypothetical protein
MDPLVVAVIAVMRAEGALRLILNTALFPHTITKRVQEKGVQVLFPSTAYPW